VWNAGKDLKNLVSGNSKLLIVAAIGYEMIWMARNKITQEPLLCNIWANTQVTHPPQLT